VGPADRRDRAGGVPAPATAGGRLRQVDGERVPGPGESPVLPSAGRPGGLPSRSEVSGLRAASRWKLKAVGSPETASRHLEARA
jgi:hypothetical protein